MDWCVCVQSSSPSSATCAITPCWFGCWGCDSAGPVPGRAPSWCLVSPGGWTPLWSSAASAGPASNCTPDEHMLNQNSEFKVDLVIETSISVNTAPTYQSSNMIVTSFSGSSTTFSSYWRGMLRSEDWPARLWDGHWILDSQGHAVPLLKHHVVRPLQHHHAVQHAAKGLVGKTQHQQWKVQRTDPLRHYLTKTMKYTDPDISALIYNAVALNVEELRSPVGNGAPLGGPVLQSHGLSGSSHLQPSPFD